MLNQIKKLFPIGPAKPKILYKYISSAKIEHYFPNLTLGYPKLQLLNDPMEASIEDMLARIKDITDLEKLVNNLFDQPLMDEGHIMRALTYLEWAKKTNKNADLREKYGLLTYCKNNIGILSLTTDPLNPLMWSLYANIYNGICIGFDTEKIISSEYKNDYHFEKCNKLFTLLKINYKKNPPAGTNLSIEDYIVSAFSTKFHNWKHEQEYRIIRPILDDNKNILIVPKSSDTITEIYIGQNFSFESFIEIIPKHVKTFIVRSHPHNYGLSAEEIYRR